MSTIDAMKIVKKTQGFERIIGSFEYEGEKFSCYMAKFRRNGNTQDFDVWRFTYNEDDPHDPVAMESCWHEEIEGENSETLFRALVKKFYVNVLKGE